jgi:hypothetical protein
MLHEWCIEGFDDGTSKRQEMCHRWWQTSSWH